MSATTALFAQLYTIDIIFYRFIARNYHASFRLYDTVKDFIR